MKEEILAILKEIHAEHDYEKSSDYLEQGLLDSFDIMTLVEMLEEKFDITVSGRDIITDNFRNLATVTALVEKYQEA